MSITTATKTEWHRVAILGFLRPDFEVLAFLNIFGFFWKSKKARQNLAKSGFFSVGKAWLWKNIVWAACSLKISSEMSLLPCSMHKRYPAEMSGLWNFSVRVQSWSNEIESDPGLIRKIFENHRSDPVLFRQRKIVQFSFASWGKRIAEAILSLAKYDWLKAK